MAILKLLFFGDAMHSFILATWCHITEDCNLGHLKYIRLPHGKHCIWITESS